MIMMMEMEAALRNAERDDGNYDSPLKKVCKENDLNRVAFEWCHGMPMV